MARRVTSVNYNVVYVSSRVSTVWQSIYFQTEKSLPDDPVLLSARSVIISRQNARRERVRPYSHTRHRYLTIYEANIEIFDTVSIVVEWFVVDKNKTLVPFRISVIMFLSKCERDVVEWQVSGANAAWGIYLEWWSEWQWLLSAN